MFDDNSNRELHVVTGAFGYSGKYIAQKLREKGCKVRTLTNSPERKNSFAGRIEVAPYNFDSPAKLIEALAGAAVLYNTYWVRFNHKTFSHQDAVRNTLTLFDAAKKAGVRRIVHVSITNPSIDSPLEYFHGKAVLEKALTESGVSYAILRPAVLFGKEDILVNNIAWALRRFPVFGVFGKGDYRLQPIYVDDFAELAVSVGEKTDNVVVNAIGPETYTYRELVKTIGKIIGRERPVLSLPPALCYAVSVVVGKLVNDIFVTRDEIKGLMSDLLFVKDAKPAGKTKLSAWAQANAEQLGVRYASELGRRRDRVSEYGKI